MNANALTVGRITVSLIQETVMIGGTNPGIGNHYGCSYYMGVEASDGEKTITIKPIRLWRDGENQCNDNPRNRYRIEGVEPMDEGMTAKVTLIDGKDIVEEIFVDFVEEKCIVLKKMKLSEILKGNEAVLQRIREEMDKENPTGYNSLEVYDGETNKVPYKLWNGVEGTFFVMASQCLYGTRKKISVWKVTPNKRFYCVVTEKSPGNNYGSVQGRLLKKDDSVFFSGSNHWPREFRPYKEFNVWVDV